MDRIRIKLQVKTKEIKIIKLRDIALIPTSTWGRLQSPSHPAPLAKQKTKPPIKWFTEILKLLT